MRSLKAGEFVVVRKHFCRLDAHLGDCFVYTEPADRHQDLQLLASSDGLLSRLQIWTADQEKYYWNASLKPDEGRHRDCMNAIKVLMDAQAVEGTGVFNASSVDVTLVDSLKELQRLEVVVRLGGADGEVTSWAIPRSVADTLEPCSRLHSRNFAVLTASKHDVPSEMSIMDLVSALEAQHWTQGLWDTSVAAKPPPINVKTGRPKRFYVKSDSSNPVLSKAYLQVLLSLSKITCASLVEHFESDTHYKWLLSDGRARKRVRGPPVLLDETAELNALMDGPRRGRGRGRGGVSGGRGRGAVEGRTRGVDPRSHAWGKAYMTYSVKKDGSEVIQATCHRTHSHPHAPGKPSTVCRQTFTVSGEHTAENCLRLLKMWVGLAPDYRHRLHHQDKRYGLDELLDDETLETLRPDSDYDTSSEIEAPPLPIVKPRMRLRKKVRVIDGEDG